METELNFECEYCTEFADEPEDCSYCGNSVCRNCCGFDREYELCLCVDCLGENDFLKCDCCGHLVSEEDQEISRFVVSDRLLGNGDWKFKKYPVSRTAGWSNFDFVCDHCLSIEDKYDYCRECEAYFDTEECDISLKENDLCYHCDYKLKKLAMNVFNRIKNIPPDIEKLIVKEYL